jgi:hypothetical protein
MRSRKWMISLELLRAALRYRMPPLNEQPRRKRRGCSFSTAFCLLRVLLQQFFRLGDEYCEPDIALPSQPPFVDPGRRRPGLNSRLHPDRHDDRPDAPALAFEIGQHPPSLALLNGLDFELSQFIPSEGAADQQGQDEVVALAFEGRAVRDCQEFLGLLTGQPVPFCRIFGMSVRFVRVLSAVQRASVFPASRFLLSNIALRMIPGFNRTLTGLNLSGPGCSWKMSKIEQSHHRKGATMSKNTA